MPLVWYRSYRKPARAALWAAALAISACGRSPTPRCASCGMRVDAQSAYRAGGRGGDGQALHFDAPKCLFRHHLEKGALRETWFIEYYTQHKAPGQSLLFVSGTDLLGPMGEDLIPVAGQAAAETMKRDHRGRRILRFSEVDAALVQRLFSVESP